MPLPQQTTKGGLNMKRLLVLTQATLSLSLAWSGHAWGQVPGVNGDRADGGQINNCNPNTHLL